MTGGVVAAVDLGATSGRVMLGYVDDGMLRLEAVARFPNGPVPGPDGLHWDFTRLYAHILDGLRDAVAREPGLASVGIDSWAVDYGLVHSGELVGEPFHYRDERTQQGVERVHAIEPFADLYRRNGLQFLPFNTLYQYATESGLTDAEAALLIPDLVAFLLTGARVAERTNASTTGLVDVRTGQWDLELAERLGVPASILPSLVDPGTRIGALSRGACEHVGAPLEVVAVGSHDTASAIVAVPLSSPNAAYISCGTWGLVGVELDEPVVTDEAREANFTNEGGVDGRVRFLHNVTGLWLLSESVRAWEAADGAAIDLPQLLEAAASVDGEIPSSTPTIRACPHRVTCPPASRRCSAKPAYRCPRRAPRSLAPSSRASRRRSPGRCIRPAGSPAATSTSCISSAAERSTACCARRADRSGLPVLAGPVEATALGNVLVQARAHGWFGADASLETLREAVAAAFPPVRYEPRAG
nr:rhamnulokinase family protein [Microbacterium flavescens]